MSIMAFCLEFQTTFSSCHRGCRDLIFQVDFCSQSGRFKAEDAALGIKSTETIECRQTLGRLKNKSAIFSLFSKDGVVRAIAALLWRLAARQLYDCCPVLCR